MPGSDPFLGGDRNRVVAIIQARMTSRRLPGKVMADLCGDPLLVKLIQRVKRARRIDQLVVATTDNASDDTIVSCCRDLGVDVFRGSEADVLSRFKDAAREFDADIVTRLTADCPMLDPALIDHTIETYLTTDCDYASNCKQRTYPDGLDVEVFSSDALERAAREASEPWLREHVTPYVRGVAGRPSGGFRTVDVLHDADFSHIRWTVDTSEDMKIARRYFARLGDHFNWQEALALATSQPDLLVISDRYIR